MKTDVNLLDQYQKIGDRLYSLNLGSVIYNLRLGNNTQTCTIEKRIFESSDNGVTGVLWIYEYTKDHGFQYYRLSYSSLKMKIDEALWVVELDRI